MPKAYWVVHVDIADPDAYAAYRAANAAPLARFGARFLIRGGAQRVTEGTARGRTVVVEFPDLASAEACYASAEYQAAKALRDPVATADLIIVEGHDG